MGSAVPTRRSASLFTVIAVALMMGASRVYAAPTSPAIDRAILRIQELIEKHDLSAARQLLATSVNKFSDDAGFDNLLGVIEAQEGHFVAAEKSFQHAIQLDPRFTGAYLNLGRLYQENQAIDLRAFEKALGVYQNLLHYDPRNNEANYQSATLYLQNRRYQESLAHLSLLSADSMGAQVLSIECADYAGLGDRQRTDQTAARLLNRPDFSEADAQQMLPALHATKRDDVIVLLLERLQQRHPLSAEVQHSLGLAYEASGKLSEARATLERYVTGGSLSVASLLELARVAHEQKDYRGSLGYLAHARDLDPNNASIHYSFGMVCLDLELVAEARNSFEKAVTLESENASYNYVMGVTSALSRDPGDAVPFFEKYLKLRPQDPLGKLALGAVLFRAKDYDAATPWLIEAAGVPQTAARAHYYLGALALEEGRLDDAANQLDSALKISPDLTDALAASGHYYLLRKNYVESEKRLQRALDLDPNHVSANFYLLTLYTRTGDPRREARAKRYDELQKSLEQKSLEVLRMVEVRPFETP
jgi:tetratricopeptide (TPR) repeat protein